MFLGLCKAPGNIQGINEILFDMSLIGINPTWRPPTSKAIGILWPFNENVAAVLELYANHHDKIYLTFRTCLLKAKTFLKVF